MKYVFGLCILVFFAYSCGEQSSSSFDEDGSRNGGWECVSGDCDNGIGTHVDSSFTQDYFEIRRYNGEWKDDKRHGNFIRVFCIDRCREKWILQDTPPQGGACFLFEKG